MLRIAKQKALFFLFATAVLLAAGCSESAEKVDEAKADAFAELFKSGFDEGDAEPSGTPAVTGTVPQLSDNQRDGIPFMRSVSVTRQAEATVADNLAQNFSFQFAMTDPAAFVRSGRVREVYQRDLAARNFPGDTVAGATALMFAVAWEQANRRELSPAQNAAILQQANEATRRNPLEKQGDREKQSQADIALTVSGLWLEEARLRERFPDQVQELSDAVRRDMMTLSGTDMRTRAVDKGGLVEFQQSSVK